MPTTTYFGITYVTPFDPAYTDLWAPPLNTAITTLDEINGRLQYPLSIQNPQAATYRLVTNSRWPFTIDQMTVQTDAGTLTGNLKIEVTSVTGLDAVAATSTESTATATAAKNLAVGENLNLTLSSIAGVGWLYVNVWCDRTAAGTA